MITKERLEELIKQETTIWVFSDDKGCYSLLLESCNDVIYEDYKDLYETEQEAQFVADNHTTRVERFEPPFKSQSIYRFNTKKFGILEILDCGDCFVISSPFTNFSKKFRIYKEAVDYAHKLFKGEE